MNEPKETIVDPRWQGEVDPIEGCPDDFDPSAVDVEVKELYTAHWDGGTNA